MIRLLLLLLVIILYLAFVIYNLEDRVVLHYVLGLSTRPLPVYLLTLGSLILGMILAVVFTLPGWIRMRMEMRRQRRTIAQMEQELNRLASMAPSRPSSDVATHADELEET